MSPWSKGLLSLMHTSVAGCAERNQIQLRILTGVTPVFLVVDL